MTENEIKHKTNPSLLALTLQGCVVGSLSRTITSPLVGWTNLTIQAKNLALSQVLKGGMQFIPSVNIFPLLFNKRVFNGTSMYVASVPPSISVTFLNREFISNYLPDTKLGNFISSFSGGFISGVIRTPFESIAQGQTLIGPITKRDLMTQIIANNGAHSLMRGGVALGFREGGWASSYLAGPLYLGAFYESAGMRNDNAQISGALTAGALFGLISCPINVLRFKIQENLHIKQPVESYWAHSKALWTCAPKLSSGEKIGLFFNGGLPRSIAGAAAALIMHEGMKITMTK